MKRAPGLMMFLLILCLMAVPLQTAALESDEYTTELEEFFEPEEELYEEELVPEEEPADEAAGEEEADGEILLSGYYETQEEETLALPYNPDILLFEYFDSGVETMDSGQEEFIDPLLYSSYNRRKLSGYDLLIYDETISTAAETAAGFITEPLLTITIPGSEFEGSSWSEAELGDSLCTGNGGMNFGAVCNLFFHKSNAILSAVRDCSYEMFWFGNSMSYGYRAYAEIFLADGVERLRITGDLTFTVKFRVSKDYRDSRYNPETVDQYYYMTDPAKIRLISDAMVNANEIIMQGNGMGDLEKLAFFRDEIKGLSAYNYDAASHPINKNDTDYYGNPWQIIDLFDGDPETTVVCEGYSKGFQYLWEKSSFAGDIQVYCVAGYLGSGGHMWNIVCIDGENYMVDITNYIPDSGYDDRWNLYLARPVSGGPNSGESYVFLRGDTRLTYRYMDSSLAMYTEAERTLPLYHEYENGVCVYCGEEQPHHTEAVSIDTSLNLVGETGLNFYFILAEGESAEDYTVELMYDSLYQPDLKRTAALSDLSTELRDGEIRYQWEGQLFVGSDEMSDMAVVTVYKGSEVVNQGRYCVAGIANSLLADETWMDAYSVLAAMLQYGHYAELQFHHNENATAIPSMAPSIVPIPSEWAPGKDPDTLAFCITSFDGALSLDASVGLMLDISPAKGYGLQNLEISVSLNGVPEKTAGPYMVGGKIETKVTDIYPDHGMDPYIITVKANGESAAYTRSVINCAYVLENQNAEYANMMEALYQYCKAAKEYWGD